MPSLVPAVPQPHELATFIVGDPVSAASVGRVWASQLAFLLGRALHHVASFAPHAIASTNTPAVIPIQWRPSPGVRCALLSVDLHGSYTTNVVGRVVSNRARATLAVTVPSGAGIRAAPDLFDGAQALAQQDALLAGRATYRALIHLGDVGDVTDAIHDLLLTVDDVGTDGHKGIASVTLVEVPLATLAPELGEVGMLVPVIDPRNDLHDGDSSLGVGVPEFLEAERLARLGIRQHWQLGTYEDTSLAWYRASATMGAIDWKGTVGTSASPKHRLRVRAPHGTSASNPAVFTLRVRHNSADDWTLRIVRAVVGGGTSNHDEAIASSGGTWAVHESGASLTLRADGTGQEIDLEFQASSVGGAPVYISSIALVQEETA